LKGGLAPRGSGALALLTLALSTVALAAAGVAVHAVTASAEAAPPKNPVEVWVAAVPVNWNVVPNEHNAIEHEEFTPTETTFRTVVYRQFTKDFAKMIPNAPGNEGIQGPLIRARVGDTVLVHFRNLDTAFNRPHSMHFHGVEYRMGSDGAYIPGFSGPGANVKPGQDFTYRLVAGPDSAGVWPYHDHSPSMMDSIEGGLYGTLSILGPNEKAPTHEFVVYLESHLGFMTINGRAFVGNTPVFRGKVGDTVQWDVLALGDDTHTFHVHGHRWRTPDGAVRDTQVVGPAESYKIRWTEDVPGTWLYHCHVESHMMNGMIGIYRVGR
jgi:FtsP/CotA-like multicopper oxidase with cupredoxin domain